MNHHHPPDHKLYEVRDHARFASTHIHGTQHLSWHVGVCACTINSVGLQLFISTPSYFIGGMDKH